MDICVKVWFSYRSHLLFLWKNKFNSRSNGLFFICFSRRYFWCQAESPLYKHLMCMHYIFNSIWIYIFKQKYIELRVYTIFVFYFLLNFIFGVYTFWRRAKPRRNTRFFLLILSNFSRILFCRNFFLPFRPFQNLRDVNLVYGDALKISC